MSNSNPEQAPVLVSERIIRYDQLARLTQIWTLNKRLSSALTVALVERVLTGPAPTAEETIFVLELLERIERVAATSLPRFFRENSLESWIAEFV